MIECQNSIKKLQASLKASTICWLDFHKVEYTGGSKIIIVMSLKNKLKIHVIKCDVELKYSW